MMNLLLMVCFFTSPGETTLWLQPLDFQDGLGETGYSRIDQVSTDGRQLFISSLRSTSVAVIDIKGKVINTFGKSGEHPAELGHTGIYAFTVAGASTWIVDSNSARARRFEDGVYKESFPLGQTRLQDSMPGATLPAVFGDEIVIPVGKPDDIIARVFNKKGEVKQDIASPLVFSEDMKFRVPGIHNTLWLREGNAWYSIHRYLPVVTQYDEAFEVVNMVRFQNKTTEAMNRTLDNFAPSERYSSPPPMITDAQFYQGKLYLLCNLQLLKIDANTGTIEGSWHFKGKGENFGRAAGVPLRLYSFAILEDKVVLAHPGLMWDHDLWIVDLPSTPGA